MVSKQEQARELKEIIGNKYRKLQEEDTPLAQEFNNLFENQGNQD